MRKQRPTRERNPDRTLGVADSREWAVNGRLRVRAGTGARGGAAPGGERIGQEVWRSGRRQAGSTTRTVPSAPVTRTRVPRGMSAPAAAQSVSPTRTRPRPPRISSSTTTMRPMYWAAR